MQYKLEKDVPLPKVTKNNKASKWSDLLNQAESGDSIELTEKDYRSIVPAAKKFGFKVRVRTVDNKKGYKRVWFLDNNSNK